MAFLALLVLGAAPPLLAQGTTEPSVVVVTAARTEQALPDALPSTRVITRREIEAVQASDLPALLRALTSIDVAQTGPMGSQASLFLRGADSRQTLVLVDGVPLARADFGTASWQYLPPDQIERIEIVRGNLSSLYGAQAIGGVVQIVTRRATVPQASVALGSQGTAHAALAAGSTFGGGETPTRIAASLSHRQTRGFSARDAGVDPGANADRDPARQDAGNLQIEQAWAPGQRTQLSYLASRTRSDYDGFAPGLPDRLTTRVDALGLTSKHALSGSVDLSVVLGQTREDFDDPTGYASVGHNRVRLGSLQLRWRRSAHSEWQLGTEAKSERYGDNQTVDRERRTDSLRAGWIGRFGMAGGDDAPWQLQANLRSDRSNDFGRATTGLLALAYSLRPGLKLSAQWASGFSAPSFLDQQYANPSTDLQPERSRQTELAAQWSAGATLARAALFVQRQRDRISFDPVTFETRNIARVRNRGIELMAQGQVGSGTLGAEVTLQDPRDEDTSRPLKRRARESLALRYGAGFGAWQGAAYLRYSGKRLDTDPLTFADADNPARTTVDLAVQRQLDPTWHLSAKLDNLFAARASEVLGYTAAPRSLLVTLQARLK